MSLRFCMIGCGAFARQFHGPAQQQCVAANPALEPAGCCDVEAGRAGEYAARHGFARAYDDWRAMLDAEKPDAVILAVPPPVTAATAAAVIERGFPLLLEKPPGLTPDELATVAAAARRAGVLVQVAFNRRHMPVVRRARALMEEFGREAVPTAVEYEMVRHAQWDPDFSTTAVHAIDGARVLAGSPFVRGRLELAPRAEGDRRAVDATFELECVTGLRVRVAVRPVAGVNRERAVVHGRGWTIDLTLPFPGGAFDAGECAGWRGGEPGAVFTDRALPLVERMGVLDETRAFFAAVQSGGAPDPGVGQCAQQVELMARLRNGAGGEFALAAR